MTVLNLLDFYLDYVILFIERCDKDLESESNTQNSWRRKI